MTYVPALLSALGFGLGLALLTPVAAEAAEIVVFCSSGMQSAVEVLVPRFEKVTGDHLTLIYDTSNLLKGRIDAGQPFDAVILTPGLVADFARQGKLVDGSAVTLARVGAGLAVKRGAAHPDIGTVEGFRQTLRQAQSVVYSASGASGGVFLAAIEKLGIAAEVKAKATLIPNGFTGDVVARGDADVAVRLVSELLPVAGVEIVGPFPAEFQSYVVLTAGIATAATDKTRAKAFIDYLHAPDAASVLRIKGMEPG